MDALVKNGIELDRAYSFKFCSPTRCALQSGRFPTHVNVVNDDVRRVRGCGLLQASWGACAYGVRL